MSVVVVGAGMGGLAAACALAGAGIAVDVVEAGPRAGGKAGIAVIDGVEVDTGPSVLTMPHVFEEVARRAGASLAEHVRLLPAEPACRYVFADGTRVDLFSDADRTVEGVTAALGAAAGREMADFLAYSRRIWEASAPAFIEGPAPTFGGVLALGPATWLEVLKIDPFRSMDAGIARFVRTRELAWILRRYATYNGSDPRRAPATLNCIAHVELGIGVFAVEGGIHALVRGLEAMARARGARFHFGRRVTSIRTASGRVAGVELDDGARLDADAVVANADAAHVAASLLPRGTRHGLPTRPEPSTSGWVGILRARRHPDRVGHTVVFPEDYGDEFVDLFDRDQPPATPAVYLCAQERCHRRRGWDDAEPVFVMANAPAEPVAGGRDAEVAERLRDAVLARLVRSGMCDADDRIVWERSPAGLAEAFPGTRGAIYGSASNDAFAAFRRPPNTVAGVPGLYLASGSAHPGGGVPLCALSGLRAADGVQAQLGRSRR